MASFCQFCGNPLKVGQAYCENCGKPVSQPAPPQPGFTPQPPQQPAAYYPPPPPPPSSSGGCWRTGVIILAVLVVLSICCAAAGVAITAATGASFWSQFKNLPSSLPSSFIPQSTLDALLPTDLGSMIETTMPDLTLEPSTILTAAPDMTLEPSTILTMIPDLTTMDPSALLTALPMQSTPVPPSAKSSGNVILLDQSSGWKLTDTNQYRTDISQQGNWAIEAKQAGLTVAVLPPGQPDSNATSFTVKVNLATDSAGQVAGVRCMLQDQNNYYQVALKDKSFAISKVVDGQPTPLTSPAWKPSQFIGSKGLNAGADIEVVCNSFGIGLSINGTAEIPLVADPDSSFSSGKVALFAGPGDKQANGYYAFATFGSFKADGSQ